jgi:excisionase family DNA binding protein
VGEYAPAPNPLPLQSVEGQSNGERRITIRKAATLLGVHPNTVRNWIKDGSIEAEKVITERGPTWMIDPDNLTTNTPTSDSQQLVGKVPQEALTMLAREIVREAGIAQNPGREARLENDKARAEAFRTLAILNTALLAGIGGVTAILPAPVHYYVNSLYGAVALAVIGIVASVFGMILSSMLVGALDIVANPSPDDPNDPMLEWWPKLVRWSRSVIGLRTEQEDPERWMGRARRMRDRMTIFALLAFSGTLVLFLSFALANLALQERNAAEERAPSPPPHTTAVETAPEPAPTKPAPETRQDAAPR